MSRVMKTTLMRPVIAAILALQVLIFKSVILVAQETKNVNVDIDVKGPAGGAWYGNWWIWAIGVAVFLIIIVALTNRGSNNTVRTD